MNSSSALEQLQCIKDLYDTILSLTKSLLKNFTQENVKNVINRRDELFKDVREAENSYKTNKWTDGNSSDCRKLKSDIKTLINSILQLDSSITPLIRHEMELVGSELRGHYSTSKAALAYASQRK